MVAWRAAGSAGLAAPNYDEIRRKRNSKSPAAMIRPARIPTSARPAASFVAVKTKETSNQLPPVNQATPSAPITNLKQLQRTVRSAAFSNIARAHRLPEQPRPSASPAGSRGVFNQATPNASSSSQLTQPANNPRAQSPFPTVSAPLPSIATLPPTSTIPPGHFPSSVPGTPGSSAYSNYISAPPFTVKRGLEYLRANYQFPTTYLQPQHASGGGPRVPSENHATRLQHDVHRAADSLPGTLVLTRAPDGAITNARLSRAPKKTRSGTTRSLL